jgi:hypothetical protein
MLGRERDMAITCSPKFLDNRGTGDLLTGIKDKSIRVNFRRVVPYSSFEFRGDLNIEDKKINGNEDKKEGERLQDYDKEANAE